MKKKKHFPLNGERDPPHESNLQNILEDGKG
jgi:hypothetical protein